MSRPDYSGDNFRCAYEADYQRCMNRGTFKRSVNGGGEWICIAHSNCKTRTEGAVIVEQSLKQNEGNEK